MKQIPRFQTMEKQKLDSAINRCRKKVHILDKRQISLDIHDFEGPARHSEGDIQQTVKIRV